MSARGGHSRAERRKQRIPRPALAGRRGDRLRPAGAGRRPSPELAPESILFIIII